MILDFGLIAEMQPQHAGDVSYVSGGTPAYMSPEECSGATPSEASDWYGVGATLYEALTGTIPFAGPALEVVMRKRTDDPPASGATGDGRAGRSERHLRGTHAPQS